MLANLINESFFQVRADWLLWVFAAFAIVLLVFGADKLVTAAVKLASAIGMSKVLIGATVVSLGTTMPEACVSVMAAFGGKPGLALGNGVGSIICDTALIFGLSCMITRLPLNRFVLYRHGVLKLVTCTLLTLVIIGLAFLAGGIDNVSMPRLVGIVFIILLAVYMYLSVRWAKEHPELIPEEAETEAPLEHRARGAIVNLLILIFGLSLVIAGSEFLVGSVSEICIRLDVPPDVLAVTMVAFGTSLPELVTAIASIVKGHSELLIGNVIGADILNVLFVIGASATASPLEVPELFFYLHLPVMMVAVFLMGSYIFTGNQRFHRWQGIPLLVLYVAYLVTLFSLRATGLITQ